MRYTIKDVEIESEVELTDRELQHIADLQNLEQWSGGSFGRSRDNWVKWKNLNPKPQMVDFSRQLTFPKTVRKAVS